MKRVLIIIFTALCIITSVGCQNQQKPNEGTTSINEVGDFNTKDVNGNEVTQSIFKDYDITMINIWATWCGACVQEMPELQRLYDMTLKQSNINMISICSDYVGQEEVAKQIIEKTGIKFTTLIPDDAIMSNVLDKVQLLPTTLFVDSSGKVIGGLQEGVPPGDVAEEYMKIINDRVKRAK